jgi:flavin reductase (DIM6/NTAB) family NADH-FMN oxidoreductase RutF
MVSEFSAPTRSAGPIPAGHDHLAAQYFAVNILSARQRGLAVRFAGPGDRFARLTHRVDPHQLPLLDGSVRSLVCRRDRLIPAGDHVVLIGSVLDYGIRSGIPLVFVDGTYHAGPAAASRWL